MGHGFGTTQTSWRPQVEKLAAFGHRVVTYEAAGTTADTLALYQGDRHGSLYGFAEDLIALMQTLEIEDANYVGHSAGGMIGILASNGQPGLFKSLSLIGSSACYIDDPATGYVGGFTREEIDSLIAAMRCDYAAWANGFSRLVTANPDRPHLASEFCRSLLALRPDIACAVLGTILRSDHRPDARQIDVPTQILQAAHDPAVPLDSARWLADAARADEFLVVPVEGHFPHISDPETITAALLDFLATHA